MARLFEGALRAQPANTDISATNDVFAETFMQLSKYDWYTLMGDVEKGVASTPGGIDKTAFPEFLLSKGCPTDVPTEDIRNLDPFDFPAPFPPAVDPATTIPHDVLKKALDAFAAALTTCTAENHDCDAECVQEFQPPPSSNVLLGLVCVDICAAKNSACANKAKEDFDQDLKSLRED